MSDKNRVEYRLGFNVSESEDIGNLVESNNRRFGIGYRRANRDSSDLMYDGYTRVDSDKDSNQGDLVDILNNINF